MWSLGGEATREELVSDARSQFGLFHPSDTFYQEAAVRLRCPSVRPHGKAKPPLTEEASRTTEGRRHEKEEPSWS